MAKPKDHCKGCIRLKDGQCPLSDKPLPEAQKICSKAGWKAYEVIFPLTSRYSNHSAEWWANWRRNH